MVKSVTVDGEKVSLTSGRKSGPPIAWLGGVGLGKGRHVFSRPCS